MEKISSKELQVASDKQNINLFIQVYVHLLRHSLEAGIALSNNP